MRLVSNSGPILSFARANRFDVLNAVVQELFIPEAVYDDIVVAGHDKVGAREAADAVWIRRTRVTDTSSADRSSSRLHAGERQAIVSASESKLPLLVDEREARKVAGRLGIPFLGSLRVLQEAKRRAIITGFKPGLHELTSAGMYISDAVFREVGESGES